ncbi:MAG: major capsid protein [Arizlama microvirus]|nr:MAG: major capsid protein [Arizlama microvirus]
MNKLFNQNKKNHVQKSAFDLSHEKKFSAKMGLLYPVFCQEVIPGDKFNINTESMIRFAPMVAPVMHRFNSYIHYFYVPNRITLPLGVWEKFITQGEAVLPTLSLQGAYKGSIADMLGIPTFTNTEPALTETINDLPLRAFYQIYKDYYIDQNLSVTDAASKIIDLSFDDFVADMIDGNNIWFTENKFKRSWEKDYFTSALPWAQKGEPVQIQTTPDYTNATYATKGGIVPPDSSQFVKTAAAPETGDNEGKILLTVDGDSIYIENSSHITVEEIRTGVRLQRFLERNARAGTRYIEHLLEHWGVRSRDMRLQRAEYIGGGKSPVVISEVLNQTGTATLPQGNMAGHGINVGRTNQASHYCEEHGFIIGIMSVMPEPNYMNGLHRLWSRKSYLDFANPEFAQLGEQEILNKELFITPHDDETNNLAFGYQSKYAEYKYAASTIHGEFRDQLDFWHGARKFETLPALTQEFIECDTEDINERIFAVTNPTVNNLYIQLYHNVTAIRPLPFFNEPSL